MQREDLAAVDRAAEGDADILEPTSVKPLLVLLLHEPDTHAFHALDALEPAAEVRGEALGLADGAPRALAVRDDDAERRRR